MSALRTTARQRPFALAMAVALTALALSGCASVDFDKALATTNREAADFTQGQLQLAATQQVHRPLLEAVSLGSLRQGTEISREKHARRGGEP